MTDIWPYLKITTYWKYMICVNCNQSTSKNSLHASLSILVSARKCACENVRKSSIKARTGHTITEKWLSKRSTMFRALALGLVLLCAESQSTSIIARRQSTIYHEPPVESDGKVDEKIEAHWIVQPVDHFNHQDKRTFTMVRN